MYKLPDLPYDYDALEPHIDAETMKIHHSKHHQGYVNKLNNALSDHEEFMEKPVKELLANLSELPEEVREGVRKFGGGHYNHSLFWQVMSPEGGGKPEGELAEEISAVFGGFEEFRSEFNAAAGGVFGSGWAWLVVDPEGGALKVVKTKNQDSPILDSYVPILGLDVWEHSFYLKWKNQKGKYIDAWWNTVNWTEVAERFQKAR